jgi:O-antigen ligase
MMLGLVNIAAVFALAVAVTFRQRSITLALLATVLALNVLLLSSVDYALGFMMGEVKVRLTEVLPLVLAVVWLMRRPLLSSTVVASLTFVWLAALAAATSFVLSGWEITWLVFAAMVFLGPVLGSVYPIGLTVTQSERLSTLTELLVLALALVSCLSVLFFGVIGGFMGWDQSYRLRGLAPIGGPIAVGAVLILFVPHFIGRVLRRPSPYNLVKAGVLISGLIFTGSRVIVATSLLVSAIVVLHHTFTSNSRGRLARVGVAMTGLTVLSVMAFPAIDKQAAFQRALGARDLTELTSRGDVLRVESLKQARSLISEAPVLGHTPGHVYPWFRGGELEGKQGNVFYTDHGISLIEPHNLYLMLGAEHGLVVLVGFVFLMAYFIRKMYRAFRITRDEAHLHNVLGVLAFLLQAMASSHLLINPRVAFFFWLVLGVWMNYAIASRHATLSPSLHDQERFV